MKFIFRQQKPSNDFILTLLMFVVLLSGMSCMTPTANPPEYSREIAKVGDLVVKEDFLRLRLRLEFAKFPKEYTKKLTHDPELKPDYDRLVRTVLDKILQDYSIIAYAQMKNIALDVAEIDKKVEDRKRAWNPKAFEDFLNESGMPLAKWHSLVSDEVRVKLILEHEIGKSIIVSTDEVSQYYNSHPQEFETAERVRVRQIVTDTLEKATELHERLLDGENFAKVAINHSLSPDRAKGGDIGYFARGTFPKEFDEVCFNLEKGDISPVVKSDYGYHIFKLLDKKPAGRKSLTEVGGQIQQMLYGEKVKRRFDEWYKEVQAAVKVEIHEDVLKDFVL